MSSGNRRTGRGSRTQQNPSAVPAPTSTQGGAIPAVPQPPRVGSVAYLRDLINNTITDEGAVFFTVANRNLFRGQTGIPQEFLIHTRLSSDRPRSQIPPINITNPRNRALVMAYIIRSREYIGERAASTLYNQIRTATSPSWSTMVTQDGMRQIEYPLLRNIGTLPEDRFSPAGNIYEEIRNAYYQFGGQNAPGESFADDVRQTMNEWGLTREEIDDTVVNPELYGAHQAATMLIRSGLQGDRRPNEVYRESYIFFGIREPSVSGSSESGSQPSQGQIINDLLNIPLPAAPPPIEEEEIGARIAGAHEDIHPVVLENITAREEAQALGMVDVPLAQVISDTESIRSGRTAETLGSIQSGEPIPPVARAIERPAPFVGSNVPLPAAVPYPSTREEFAALPSANRQTQVAEIPLEPEPWWREESRRVATQPFNVSSHPAPSHPPPPSAPSTVYTSSTSEVTQTSATASTSTPDTGTSSEILSHSTPVNLNIPTNSGSEMSYMDLIGDEETIVSGSESEYGGDIPDEAGANGDMIQGETYSQYVSRLSGLGETIPKRKTFHKESLSVFFGSTDRPAWDPQLLSDRRERWKNASRSYMMNRMMKENKCIFDKYQCDLFLEKLYTTSTSSIKSVLEENEELLQLYFSLKRNMAKGARLPTAQVNMGQLVQFRNQLAQGTIGADGIRRGDNRDAIKTTSTVPVSNIEPDKVISGTEALAKAWDSRLHNDQGVRQDSATTGMFSQRDVGLHTGALNPTIGTYYRPTPAYSIPVKEDCEYGIRL